MNGKWVNAKPPPMDMFEVRHRLIAPLLCSALTRAASQEIAWKKKQKNAKAEWEAANPGAAAPTKVRATKPFHAVSPRAIASPSCHLYIQPT